MSHARQLAERDREVAVLKRTVQTRGAALVVGPFGAGKSSLLAVARTLARDLDATVLEAAGAETEQDFPYGVLRQLLEPPLLTAAPEERTRLLGGSAAAVQQLIAGEPCANELANEAVMTLLERLAARAPVCVLVDDLHWADAGSRAALAFVVEQRGDADLTFVGTTETLESDVDRWLAAGAVELRPAPLTEDGVRDLLAAHLAEELPPEEVRACCDASGGVPFLVDQLVGALGRSPGVASVANVVQKPPPAIQRTVRGRLRAIDDEASNIAHAIAVLDDPASALAAEVAGIDERRAVAALDRLRGAGLSPHPLIRSTVYQQVPVAVRSQLHARAATVLTRSGAPPFTVARHILESPQDAVPGAASTLAAAVEEAQRHGELDAVARYLRRRLEEAEEVDVETVALLGSVELRLGQMRAAAANLARVHPHIEEPDDRFRAVAELGTALIYQGEAGEAMDVLEPAVAAARQAGSDMVHVLEATQAVAGWSDHDVFERIRRARPLIEDEVGTPRTEGEHVRLGRIVAEHAMHGSAFDARRVAASGSGDRLGDGRHLLAFHLRELALVFADDPEILDALARVEMQARHLGSSTALEIVRALRVTALARRGELNAAEAEGQAVQGSLATVAVAECRLERGDLDGAADALEHSRRAHLGWGVDLFRLLALGRLQARRGQLPEALTTFEKCARIEARWSFAEPSHASWRTETALVHHAMGNRETAATLAIEGLERARRYGSERLQGLALMAAARIGCVPSRQDALLAAIEQLDHAEARVAAARARFEYGSLLRRQGAPRDARVPLRQAAELAAAVGAADVEHQVARELELAGAGVRPDRSTDELTAGERRTAELAAEGLTNRQIAARLLLSEKTVEMHLSRVYAKLGVRSRRELPPTS